MELNETNDINNSSATIQIVHIDACRYTAKITLFLHKHNNTIKVRHSTIYGTINRVQKIDRKITFKSDGVYVRFQWDTLRQTRCLTVHAED